MENIIKVQKINRNGIIKRRLSVLLLLVTIMSSQSCNKYLDIVPDNVATLDNAFTMRVEAEKYLFTCYSFLPLHADPTFNIAFSAGDETWVPNVERWTFNMELWNIAKGFQGKADPYANYWDGSRLGRPLFQAIRECNTFLSNVRDESKVLDLGKDERIRWLGEVEFLKAYYYFYLLRMYGPLPIMDENILISAPAEEVWVKRMPVDSCVNYIVGLLNAAEAKLPNIIVDESNELGRVTRPAALALKAKVLLMAASPLFNGNSDYANFKDKQGQLLFNGSYDETKWQKAADAAKIAITAAEEAGFSLFEFNSPPYKLSDTTIIQLSIRNAVTERWNNELIWGNSNSRSNFIQRVTMGNITNNTDALNLTATSQVSATMKMAELFYTKNGVPITEDNELDFSNPNSLRTATHDERFNISQGYETARINFDRENRFYANLGFDGGIWFMYSTPARTDENTYVMKAKRGQLGNEISYGYYSESGYFVKKLADWESNFESNSVIKEYPWPEIRLADIYLMYAEALNEVHGPNNNEIFEYLDRIRARAGLASTKISWETFSKNPSKITTKNGMREIIHQERLIEMAFEGSRYWDLLRWKKANEVLNRPIKGWTINGSESISYYQPRVIFQQKFIAPRDYFWPIREYTLTVNPNLVQNPGW